LGGNSLSDLLVFGRRAGTYAAEFSKQHRSSSIDQAHVDRIAKQALEPLDHSSGGENPFKIQEDLQAMMQDLVGIVREESEMLRALSGLSELRERARHLRVPGNREYNAGWHTALDLANLFTISEAITRCAIERKESRGGHFREDYPNKDPAAASFNIVVKRDADGEQRLRREPIPPLPPELQQVIEENK
jgi:succinate dehydrogenase / fumarate reductase flavoprotein subunit